MLISAVLTRCVFLVYFRKFQEWILSLQTTPTKTTTTTKSGQSLNLTTEEIEDATETMAKWMSLVTCENNQRLLCKFGRGAII